MFVIIGGLVAAVIFTAAGMLYNHDDKRLAIGFFFLGGVLTLLIVCKVWCDSVTADRPKQSHSPPNELDKSSLPMLNKPRASSPPESPVPTETPRVKETPTATPSPSVIVTPTPSARATPTPTPEPTSDAPYVSNDPKEVGRKLQEAKNHGTSKQIREALVNMPVDWKLLFWQAEYTNDKTQVSAFLIWRSVAADAATTDL